MSKFAYTYNNLTKEYQVTRDGVSSAYFKHLRDCKLSWKFMISLIKASKRIEVITDKEIKDDDDVRP